MAGKIFVITGSDCAGKSTQVMMLMSRLNLDGARVRHIKFPVYDSPTGKIISRYLGRGGAEYEFGHPNSVAPKIASTWYALNRVEMLPTMRGILDDGVNIVCDRYVESNMAHQASKLPEAERGEFIKWVEHLEYHDFGLIKPSATIFLHVPYAVSLAMAEKRGGADGHESCEEHMKNTEEVFIQLASIYKWSTVECVVNGGFKPSKDISEEIGQIIDGLT